MLFITDLNSLLFYWTLYLYCWFFAAGFELHFLDVVCIQLFRIRILLTIRVQHRLQISSIISSTPLNSLWLLPLVDLTSFKFKIDISLFNHNLVWKQVVLRVLMKEWISYFSIRLSCFEVWWVLDLHCFVILNYCLVDLWSL